MTRIIQKYLSYLRYERNYSLHTEISYSKDLQQFEDFLKTNYEGIEIANVRSEMVRQWIASLMEEGITSRTVNRKLSALKSFYRFLIKMREVEINPLKKITGPKTDKSLPTFLNDSEMAILLDEEWEDGDFDKFRSRTIIELLYVTGMRRAEVLNLKNQDIDLSSDTIRVTGKRNKQRLIPFSKDTRSLLEKYIDKKKEVCLELSEYFFVKNDGMQMYPMLIYRIVHEYLGKIPRLDKASPHMLRHSFATSMLNNGAEINAVKELLGHSSLASTEVYTHTTFEELKKAYKKAHPRA